ncbi:MAG: GTP-binding protein [Chloroflexi bacterium]|nr:MAG: GTP-binding protein [Chloroflexota bacterium]
MPALSKKVCLLGDFAVGKTSLVRRFVYNLFEDRYISTIGVKVSRKTVTIPDAAGPVELTMMLWDLAGSEEFNQIQASYLRGAAGAILVCDLTRPETVTSLTTYAGNLTSINENVSLVVAANKNDLVNQLRVAPDEVAAVAASLGAPFYLTSAKTGDEVEAVFRHLGRLLVKS